MKILILLSRVPYPLEKGDKLRAFHQLKYLSQKNEIILCCFNDKQLHPEALKNLQPYCTEIKIIKLTKLQITVNLLKGMFSKLPFQVHYFYSKSAQKQVDLLIEKHLPKHIFCQLIRVSEYVKKYSIFYKTLDYMDAISAGVERRVDKSPFYLKPFLKTELNRLQNYESKIFDFFEEKVIISEQDKNAIAHPRKNEIKVIPNGVQFDFFAPQESDKTFDLLFTGNMSYPPNIESVTYLVNVILPIVKKEFPNIKLLISGTSPTVKVRNLASDNVFVSGWVNDMRESYQSAKIFIAPMNIGAGLQNKLLEAMAMKLPCITSLLANNALRGEHNKDLLIGKAPKEYAQFVSLLLKDVEKRKLLAENGCQFVKEKFNWENTSEKLEGIITENSKNIER